MVNFVSNLSALADFHSYYLFSFIIILFIFSYNSDHVIILFQYLMAFLNFWFLREIFFFLQVLEPHTPRNTFIAYECILVQFSKPLLHFNLSLPVSFAFIFVSKLFFSKFHLYFFFSPLPLLLFLVSFFECIPYYLFQLTLVILILILSFNVLLASVLH